MKYSIILPVHNGGIFIKDCIDSILAQSLTDFELIVLENYSSDDTVQIITSIGDRRVKMIPSGSLLSIEQNWARIKDIPKNEFITIIGHDDLLDTNYLQVMDDLITAQPGAGLYQAHFRYIDSKGDELKKCLPMAAMQLPQQVIHNFLCSKMDIMGTGFMMRSRDFDATGGMPSYPNLLFADMELWIELSRRSYLAVAADECFSYRKHLNATTSTSTDTKVLTAFDQFVNYLEQLKQTDPSLAQAIGSDCTCLLNEYCQGITHRILRTPKRLRQTPSVGKVIDQFREYGRRLRNDNNFEPLDVKVVKMGKLIDSNDLTRSLFLLFKKLIPKPVL